ncbi:TIM barrel protein [Burkholderia sp. SR8]|uniref:sugar phosphate isomerase/epimerase family protein n=1 Tax=Burkholderia sp. SR8 TaxID=3062277 RepID=UPI004062C833
MIKHIEMNQLSIANLTVGGGNPVELIEAAAAAGFGKVGLVLRTATTKALQYEIVGRPEVMREVKAASRANGVSVFDVEAFTLTPSADLASYESVLATGAELGATHISAIGAEIFNAGPRFSEQERIDFFGRLCDAAAGFGLHVGVEFMLYRDVSTLGDTLALLAAAGRQNAGVILDVLHFHRSGARPEELDTVPDDRFAYVQLCDAGQDAPPVDGLATEARTARLHVGSGVIPLDAMLDRVPEHMQLVIETPVKADAALNCHQKVERAADAARRFFQHRQAAAV